MTQTQQQTAFLFPNLFAAIKEDKERTFDDFLREIKAMTNEQLIENCLPYSRYWYLLPAGKRKNVKDVPNLKEYIISRERKNVNDSISKSLERMQTVSNAPDLISITFNIEWKKSRMWGSNPTCEAKEETDRQYNYYNSGSIGGCGYDKESTAIAHAANQSNSFLKALYLAKETAPAAINRELLGYGSGYGILPQLEGGVGVSCYPRIFEAIGFTWKNVGSGKLFDVYVATRNK